MPISMKCWGVEAGITLGELREEIERAGMDPRYKIPAGVSKAAYLESRMADGTYYPVQTRICAGDLVRLVKKLLRLPLRFRFYANRTWVKKSALIFGNSICCPSCTYNYSLIGDHMFDSGYSFALDWENLLSLAERPGRFVCVEEPLVFHRLHKDAATNACMKDSRRYEEEKAMFQRLWPRPAAEFLMGFYKKAYTSYEENGTEKKDGK